MTETRRRATRVPVRIPAGVYLKGKPNDVMDAEILDISEGGAFVHCPTLIAVGKEVIVEIRFAETKIIEGKVIEHEELIVNLAPGNQAQETSVVRWQRENSGQMGFGIEFSGLAPESQKFLTKLVQYFEQLQRAGVNFSR